jgi:hypothetical protein
MTDKTREKALDALKADVARLREEMASLAAGVKKFAEAKTAEPHAEGGNGASQQGASENGGRGQGAFTDYWYTLEEAWALGEKILKVLAVEIERHPLVGSTATFGLGFIIAKLWYRGGKP